MFKRGVMADNLDLNGELRTDGITDEWTFCNGRNYLVEDVSWQEIQHTMIDE
jgi:hypothetical protein